jgi:hypothetical protein
MSILTPIQFIDLMYNMDDRVFLDNFRLKTVNSASEIRRTLIGKILEGFNKSDTASWGVDAFPGILENLENIRVQIEFFNSSESFKVLSQHSTLLKDISSIVKNPLSLKTLLKRYFLPVYASLCFQTDLYQRPEESASIASNRWDRSFERARSLQEYHPMAEILAPESLRLK